MSYLRVEHFRPRFVSEDGMRELFNLYHLARTALSGKPCGRWERLNYAATEYHKAHPETSATAAYKDLSDAVQF